MTGSVSGLANTPSLWIALRYLVTHRRRYASFISWVSIVGLALGVAVLIVVISVMNGFDAELKRRILGAVPHLLLETDSVEDMAGLQRLPGIDAAFAFFEADGMVTRGGAVNPVAIHGLDEVGLRSVPILGSIALEPGGVALGAPLARYLGIREGDDFILVTSTPAGDTIRPRIERVRLDATFEVGAELDFGLVLMRLDDVGKRNLLASGREGVRLVLDDPLRVGAVRDELQSQPGALQVSMDWRDQFGELFKAVRMEKGMMFLLLLLIVAVAAFNIISAQTMLVNDKRADIAILTTMGASRGLVMRVVLMQGLVVAVLGIGLGLGFGIALSLNVTETMAVVEAVIGARLIDGTFFDEIPVRILASDLAVIVVMSLGLCVISCLHPARRAAALNPAEVLHDA
jgi:lipoprotein-releasing system permease protein